MQNEKIKVGDEYFGNHTHKKYTVVGIEKGVFEDKIFNMEREDGIVRNWTKNDIENGLYKNPKPSAKEPIEEVEGFYMVVVTEPLFLFPEKYKSYDDAHKQSMYMSSKQNTTAYVLKAVAQVEQVSKITNFKK